MLAEEIKKALEESGRYSSKVMHRDIEK